MNLWMQLGKILNSQQGKCQCSVAPLQNGPQGDVSINVRPTEYVLRTSWTWCSCILGTSITTPHSGDEGGYRGWVHPVLPWATQTRLWVSGMLSHHNISPVQPNLREHHNSNKTCLSYFLPPFWNRPSSSFPGRVVTQIGSPESQISKAWQPRTSGCTSYIPWAMQPEISLSRSHILEGIPNACLTIYPLIARRNIFISFKNMLENIIAIIKNSFYSLILFITHTYTQSSERIFFFILKSVCRGKTIFPAYPQRRQTYISILGSLFGGLYWFCPGGNIKAPLNEADVGHAANFQHWIYG